MIRKKSKSKNNKNMKFHLSKKIALFVGIIIIVISILLGTLSVTFSSKFIMAETEQNMQEYADECAQNINLTIEKNIGILNELANRETVRSMDWSIQVESLYDDVERLGYLDMAIVLPDGTANYIISGGTSQLGDREYVMKAFDGQANISDVLISKVTNEAVIMYAAPITKDGSVVGVLIGRREGVALNEITDEMGIGEKGYSFILGQDGVIYSHPNHEYVMNQVNVFDSLETQGPFASFAEALEELGLGNSGVVDYEYEETERLAAMAKIPNTEWTILVGNYRDTILKNIDSMTNAIIVISIIACIFGVIIAMFLGRSISKPIKHLLKSARKITDGDLDVKIDVKSNDEIGEVANAFTDMAHNLNKVITNINAASQQVAYGSSQVSDSSMSLSQGATEQASPIEQLTASIEQITAQTKNNASNADKAKDISYFVKDKAFNGDSQMNEMLDAMSQINEASNNIFKIIKVIDDISFQTNILALNASIEAARAGQHGKGFAVVAEEVRNLAARSAAAAKETTVMIENSINKVEDGAKIANSTADALHKIVEGIGEVSELISNIAIASNEQAIGLEQINKGVIQITDVVQTTSATSEETAAASEELLGQAEMLKEQVSMFKLKDNNIKYNDIKYNDIKYNDSYENDLDDLNPEVIKMLTDMSSK
ncbi:methyl-accepting chemotaxis protein [Clostridium sp. DL1XJH146]